MSYKKIFRLFVIFLLILSIIISSIPAINENNRSFSVYTYNNIIKDINNTKRYITKNQYTSAIFMVYGGLTKLDLNKNINIVVKNKTISQNKNYEIKNEISIYKIDLGYNKTSYNGEILNKCINNTICINLNPGHYMIKYNVTIILYKNISINDIIGFNTVIVTMPSDNLIPEIAILFSIPTAFLGIMCIVI